MFRRKKRSTAFSPTGEGRAFDDEHVMSGEEEEMAMYWEQEELATQNRWDEQEEIDYQQMAKQHNQTRAPDMVSYNRLVTRTVKFLGIIRGLQDNRPSADDCLELMDAIDKAQRDGRLPYATQEEDLRVITLSKYGIKVMDDKGEQVRVRHALHRIANLVFYEDRYGKAMLALKIGEKNSDKHDIYVYEAPSSQQAEDTCATLAQAFESVYRNWQRNELSG
ncbi:uncharacterized protein LOC135814816 isoform X1 [Sycon ciliatum]|uniref:uncharacterized protein LOC135814816 isoform X1 n=1 Tax=Sycon ciliatum TaxID=27933 RepID=UPI0031F680E8